MCPICNSQHPKVAFQASPLDYSTDTVFDVLKCTSCGHGFTTGLIYNPSDYEGGSYDTKERFWHRLSAPVIRAVESSKAKYFVGQLTRSARILEIGSGKGRFVKMLRGKGYQAFGIEPSKRSFGFSKHLGYTFNCMLNEINTIQDLRAPFDAVVLWHVIEHLEKPGVILDEIQQVIAKDGMVLIGVPNFDSHQAVLGKSDWYHLDPSRHISHFTPQSLTLLAEKHGYRVERSFFDDYYQNWMGEIITATNKISPLKNVILNSLRWNPSFLKRSGKAGAILLFIYNTISSALLLPFVTIWTLVTQWTNRGGTMIFVLKKKK